MVAVFRRRKNRIEALRVEEPWEFDDRFCTGHYDNGLVFWQGYEDFIKTTKPCTPKEYEPLKQLLEKMLRCKIRAVAYARKHHHERRKKRAGEIYREIFRRRR
jgi:hypothetical protein